MKRILFVIMTACVLGALTSCSSDRALTPIEGAPEAKEVPQIVTETTTQTGENLSWTPNISDLTWSISVSTGAIMGRDASGQIIPFGTPGVISTEIPKNARFLKKEYTNSSGNKTLFEWIIFLEEDETIREIQIFNPNDETNRFSKITTPEIIGKKARDLKLETIDGLEGIVDAFNQSLAEAVK